MNDTQNNDVRKVHAIAHARKIRYPAPGHAVAALSVKVAEKHE